MIIPEANRSFVAQRLGIDASKPIGLNAGEHFSTEDIQIHAIPAAHNTLDKNIKGQHPYLGYMICLGN